MPTIDVNDTTLYYERAGDGPAILFVHGMCGDADVWADQARQLEDRYACVRYDRRGHSRSARGHAAISDSLHADDTAALIETLDLAPCLLVGSSGGAAIAVEVAVRYPQLLRAAVFSEPPLFCLDRDAGQAVMNELVPRLEQATANGGPARASMPSSRCSARGCGRSSTTTARTATATTPTSASPTCAHRHSTRRRAISRQ